MHERGSYIPWARRFRRYLNRKRETRKFLNHSIDVGPYELKMIQPDTNQEPILETEDDLTSDALKQYEADIKAMNLILISIPNCRTIEVGGGRLVPSCFVIFDLEPLSLSFDFVFMSEIFKSLSFSLDRLCHLAILYLEKHAHTLHHLESFLTISLDRLDILKEDLVYQSLQKSLSLILELS
ncbi:hypothetical protein Tco_0470884 [Tanacetum coccineum]